MAIKKTSIITPTFGAITDGVDQTQPTDPFNLERFRVSQNFADAIGVKRALLTVPVKKPDRQWFIRVRPEETYRVQALVLELHDEREMYLVDPTLSVELGVDLTLVQLFTAINRQGTSFLWPVKLTQDKARRRNEWNESALAAAELAMKRWVSVRSKFDLGAYEAFAAADNLDEPEWPELSFSELLAIAFKHRIIETPDHLVIRQLRGET